MGSPVRVSQKTDDMVTRDELVKLIESELEVRCRELQVCQPLLGAVRYALFPAGKRVRPLFALAHCIDLGGEVEPILPAALALELIHAASLIHDDLPAIDNDDFRRGRPSCHKAFGEATAILAGDLLLTWAFEFIASAELPSASRVTLSRLLSQTFVTLCHGQQLDLLPENERGDLKVIHASKTGALFAASLAFGAIGAGLTEHFVKQSSDAGMSIGICFQLIDDFLDLTQHSEEKGRPESSDARNKKVTFLSSSSIEEAQQLISAQRQNIAECFSTISSNVSHGGTQIEFPLTQTIFDLILSRFPYRVG